MTREEAIAKAVEMAGKAEEALFVGRPEKAKGYVEVGDLYCEIAYVIGPDRRPAPADRWSPAILKP